MKKQDKDPRFRTHIPEPRWQQVISVIVVAALVAVWAWVAFIHH